MLGLAETTDLLRLLGDPSRLRLLALVAEHELSVAELTRVTRLAQSRVSTHLAKLKSAGFLQDRRDGVNTYYRLDAEGLGEAARRAWTLVRDAARDPVLEQDRERLARVRSGRSRAETWADSVAGQMDRHYSPGRTWEATAWGTLGLAALGRVLDVASGDGVLAELVAPRARHVTCLDLSAKVTAAGQRRLARLENVAYCRGDMHALPFRDGAFDQVLLMNALTYSAEPARVFAEAARVLRPAGQLVGVTLKQHGHRAAAQRFNHLQLGFAAGDLERWLGAAGFQVELCAVTSRERRRPHFEVITLHAARARRGREAPSAEAAP